MHEQLSTWEAFDVKPQQKVRITVCNAENNFVQGVTMRGIGLVPTLINDVGTDAKVVVVVKNSANVNVKDRMVVGRVLPEGPPVPQPRSDSTADTSMVDKLITGKIDHSAQIYVIVEDSANINLQKGTADFHIGKATLLNELVDGVDQACVNNACIQVDVKNSANVNGNDENTSVYIRDGQLDDESLDFGCIGTGTKVYIGKDNVANVNGVGALHIYDGELSDESVDAANLNGAEVYIDVNNVGNVNGAKYVRILDGELVDELLDVKDVTSSIVSIKAFNIGNVDAATVWIYEGELVDEAFDALDITKSNVQVSVENSANVLAVNSTYINEGELIDEVIDTKNVIDTPINIRVLNVANVRCSKDVNTKVIIVNGELLEAVLDVENNLQSQQTVVSVRDSGNTHVLNGKLTLTNSTLAKAPVDVEGNKTSPYVLAMSNSGKNNCGKCLNSCNA